MLSRNRAKEVGKLANQWPNWGNYCKYLTDEETDHVGYIYMHAKSGNVSTASIVESIARGIEIELKDGVPKYEVFIGKA